ncbi:MAG: hypothetical protein AB7V48_08690 [Sedimentibacter sp.]
MENCCAPDNIETIEDINIQCDCDRNRGSIGGRGEERRHKCIHDRDRLAGIGGVDSSLLFFFLLLVAIVCQSDCDIDMDTLLWFFLLLVVLYNRF